MLQLAQSRVRCVLCPRSPSRTDFNILVTIHPAFPVQTATPAPSRHIPVLLAETLAALSPVAGQTLLDATAGLGGHAAAIAPLVGPRGRIALSDLDPDNLRRAFIRCGSISAGPGERRIIPLYGSFAEAPRKLQSLGLSADLVLADLGFASNQVDDALRGMSFSRPAPLDMRLNPAAPVSAATLVATASEGELMRIISDFGEERFAPRVARAIVAARAQRSADAPPMRTDELAAVISAVVPATRAPDGSRGIHPATRTFQALRIATNDELGHLGALLDAIADGAAAAGSARPTWLAKGARIAIITFHSLEDRPVKQAFADLVSRGLATEITRKPVVAGENELATNPRARSAKLRAIKLC